MHYSSEVKTFILLLSKYIQDNTCTKFYQNWQSFVDDMTNILDQVIIKC